MQVRKFVQNTLVDVIHWWFGKTEMCQQQI